jgi:hypothetical protein
MGRGEVGERREEKEGCAVSRGFVVAFKMLKAIMVDVESGHCRQWKREVPSPALYCQLQI